MRSECIAVYDACDGVVQCSDGSDEISCQNQQGSFSLLLTVTVAWEPFNLSILSLLATT